MILKCGLALFGFLPFFYLCTGEVYIAKNNEITGRGLIATDSNGNVFAHFGRPKTKSDDGEVFAYVQQPEKASGLVFNPMRRKDIDPIFLQPITQSKSSGIIALNSWGARLFSYPLRETALSEGERLGVIAYDKHYSKYEFVGKYAGSRSWDETGTLYALEINPPLSPGERDAIMGASVVDENYQAVGNIYGFSKVNETAETKDFVVESYWVTPLRATAPKRIPLPSVGVPLYDLRRNWKKVRLTLFPPETIAFSPLIEPLFDETDDGTIHSRTYQNWVHGMIETELDRCHKYLPNLNRLQQDIQAGLRASLYVESGRVSSLGAAAQSMMIAAIKHGLPIIEEEVRALCEPYLAKLLAMKVQEEQAEKEKQRLVESEKAAAKRNREKAEYESLTLPQKILRTLKNW